MLHINGTCSTWFVLKWLEKHPNHTANAPNTSSLWPCEASTNGIHCEFRTMWPEGYDYQKEGSPPFRRGSPPFRNDWTIYNEHGRRVRFKRIARDSSK
jgi:hypothetical protein